MGPSVSILFADICESMHLYRESGDAQALAIVARRLDALAAVAASHGGDVVRSKGDDVLCVFDEAGSALAAAEAMLDPVETDSAAVHVGLHRGHVIAARSDVYGDAVNVAARMLALAKPGEVVASSDLVEALPPARRGRLVRLGSCAIKGRPTPLDVYSLVLDDGVRTQLLADGAAHSAAASPATVMPSVMVELYYEGQTFAVGDGERCVIGRAERCDLRVEDPRVSREHAWVQVQGGRAALVDRSSTGSWILGNDGSHATVRRDSSVLDGHGAIRLARHPRDRQAAPEIYFSIRVIA